MEAKVLVIGNGGRENAIVWKLANSKNVGKIFVAPGNAGTEQENKAENIDLNISDQDKIVKWCLENQMNLVVIGPEVPLAEGGCDVLTFLYLGQTVMFISKRLC